MTEKQARSKSEVEALYQRLDRDARAGGYHLNPDNAFTMDLVTGLVTNEGRYGYPACPCRLASGNKAEDLDIICPCDYRDADLGEYGACYCALYVSGPVAAGKQKVAPIPERRPPPEKRTKPRPAAGSLSALPLPVWRCSVCGYLCARDGPPEVCPICKATKERFGRFI
jgi:ferredoxin-thioredoxin reductase catalytic subunit